MHILFVCSEMPPAPHGGIGIFVRSLADELLKKGINVTVAGYDKTVDADQEKIEDGVKVYRFFDPYIRRNQVLLFKKYYVDINFYLKRRHLSKLIRSIVRAEQVDLVESYDWSGPLWSHPGVPVIVRMHGANTAHRYLENKRYGRILSYVEKRNLKLAHRLVAVSQHMGEATMKAFGLKKPFEVIHNPVDTTRFSTKGTRDVNKLVYVGRIHEIKGLYELFPALHKVMSTDEELYAELYGGGGEETVRKMKDAVPEDIRDRVTFMGHVSHDRLPQVYSSAGLMLCPSRAEAFGLTAAEAMACGTPVLITRETSGPEIIEEGLNGKLTSILDKNALANDLETTIRDVRDGKFDPQKIRQYAVDHFSIEKIIEQNLTLYRDCLAKK
ncbi:MAG: glycosyltransferase family 4 protein [Cyclobacteriaceae bacterium]